MLIIISRQLDAMDSHACRHAMPLIFDADTPPPRAAARMLDALMLLPPAAARLPRFSPPCLPIIYTLLLMSPYMLRHAYYAIRAATFDDAAATSLLITSLRSPLSLRDAAIIFRIR